MKNKETMVINYILKLMKRLDVNWTTEGVGIPFTHKNKKYEMQFFIKEIQ